MTGEDISARDVTVFSHAEHLPTAVRTYLEIDAGACESSTESIMKIDRVTHRRETSCT